MTKLNNKQTNKQTHLTLKTDILPCASNTQHSPSTDKYTCLLTSKRTPADINIFGLTDSNTQHFFHLRLEDGSRVIYHRGLYLQIIVMFPN